MEEKCFETTKTLQFVSEFLGLDLTQKCRKRPVVEGRMMYAKLMKRYTNVSSSDIGRAINKDHATVIHYLKNFQYVKKVDQNFASKFEMMSDAYEEFRDCWLDDEKFDERKKIKFLESSIKELLDRKSEYEKYFNKIKRIDSIVQMIEQRTPKGEEEYVESKINRMFNSIIFNP